MSLRVVIRTRLTAHRDDRSTDTPDVRESARRVADA
jgi:hypothetical protein